MRHCRSPPLIPFRDRLVSKLKSHRQKILSNQQKHKLTRSLLRSSSIRNVMSTGCQACSKNSASSSSALPSLYPLGSSATKFTWASRTTWTSSTRARWSNTMLGRSSASTNTNSICAHPTRGGRLWKNTAKSGRSVWTPLLRQESRSSVLRALFWQRWSTPSARGWRLHPPALCCYWDWALSTDYRVGKPHNSLWSWTWR